VSGFAVSDRCFGFAAFAAVEVVAVPVGRGLAWEAAAGIGVAGFPAFETAAGDGGPFCFCHVSSCSQGLLEEWEMVEVCAVHGG